MKGPRKSADQARHGKAFPATMTPTKSLWNLSGGGVGVVAVCGATVVAVYGGIVVAVCGVMAVRAACGVTDSTVRIERVLRPAVVSFLMLIGHECCVTGQRTFVAVG
jgi:hypothetical protein